MMNKRMHAHSSQSVEAWLSDWSDAEKTQLPIQFDVEALNLQSSLVTMLQLDQVLALLKHQSLQH